MTVRLYDRDVDMLEFSAVVKTCEQREKGYIVTLDQTAFFPEGGGQGADHGTLDGVQVLDAHEANGEVEHLVSGHLRNIILIGMPGSGKSAVAAALGKALDREVVEADELIALRTGMSIPEIFAQSGEETFRKLETEVLAEQGKRSGIILSTGGGCVTRPENYPLLHQNGTIFRLTRDLAKLPTEGRPISQTTDLAQLCARREPLYRRFADVTVSNDGALEVTVQTIKEALL